MLLTRDISHGDFEIKSYEPGKLKINDTLYSESVLICAHELKLWAPQTFKELTPGNFNEILELKPDLFLLGTGTHWLLPPKNILQLFYERSIGIEVMTTISACHTFNVLMSEERNVLAGLIIR
jgi:uncharacterized protein